MKDFTFYNVMITISAETGAEAYTKLCAALCTIERADFLTDTYSEEGSGEMAYTAGLWPKG